MMNILTCSTGTHHFNLLRNKLKLFEMSSFFVKSNTKWKSRRFICMKHTFDRIIWHVVESIRVCYICKRSFSTPFNIFKHASIKCLRTIDLKNTLLTLSLPLLHFFCLFWVYRHIWELFTHMDMTIAGEALRNLTYARNSVVAVVGFFNVPHLLWNGLTLYNGHLRGPVTLTPIPVRLTVVLSLPVFTT